MSSEMKRPCGPQYGLVRTALALCIINGVSTLHDVQLSVPSAVRAGHSATLGCAWTLDSGETLYSVKWYRGGEEFYRYIPKELPHTRVFPLLGVNVDVNRSGAKQVTLRETRRALAGRFRCEVSADAPSFHTEVRSAYMHVVELPESAPSIRAEKASYSAGDVLRARCFAPPADPPANLTWLLNGHSIQGSPVIHDLTKSHLGIGQKQTIITTTIHPIDDANNLIFSPWKTIASYENTRDIGSAFDDNLKPSEKSPNDFHKVTQKAENPSHVQTTTPNFQLTVARPTSFGGQDSKKYKDGSQYSDFVSTTLAPEISKQFPSTSELLFTVGTDSFERGRMTLTCVSSVYSIYSEKTDLFIDEEKPQIASVLGTRESSNGSTSNQISGLMPFIQIWFIAYFLQQSWFTLR